MSVEVVLPPMSDQCQSSSFCYQCQTSVSRARSATNVSPLSDQCQSSSVVTSCVAARCLHRSVCARQALPHQVRLPLEQLLLRLNLLRKKRQDMT